MRKLLWVLPLVLLFISCQKETSFETPITIGGTSSGTAVYTLGGAGSACTGATVNGTYTSGVVLTSANSVTIAVTVTTIGTYSISTATVNGITFTGAGIFTNTGTQTITLTASGKPVATETSTFSIPAGTATCTFSVVVTATGSTTTAVYTIAGAGSSCTGSTISGTYTVNVPLNSANTVTIQVNVTGLGSYTITTTTINGFSFSGTGNFTKLGVQAVILTGAGKPTNSETDVFTAGTSGCTFGVLVAAAPPPAIFTLTGSPNACTGSLVNGTYTANAALTAANTEVISVNVTTAGSYTINTNSVNGITFYASGVFVATGVQNVILVGSGTPTIAATSTFTPQVGSSQCTFSVVVGAAAAVAPGVYNCKIDGTYISFDQRSTAGITDPFGKTYLALQGYAAAVNGLDPSQFQIFITNNDNSSVKAGNYDVNNFLKYRIEIDYTAQNPDLSTTIWNTSSTVIPPSNPQFTVVVTSITATRVKGTFSGTLTNTLQGSTLQKTITAGTFDLPIQ